MAHINIPQEDISLAMVITDIGKDMDDCMALCDIASVTSMPGYSGELCLLSVVTNLMDPLKRARTARALLDALKCEHIPVGVGSDGSSEDHRESEYEYNPRMTTSEASDVHFFEGQPLMRATLEAAVKCGRKVKVLCISSLRDIAMLCATHPSLVNDAVEGFYVQGGVEVTAEGRIRPSQDAANNRFDMEASKNFYRFVESNGIKCVVCTKHAAMAAKLERGFPSTLEKIGGDLPKYLREQFEAQMMKFYLDSCGPAPYAPFMNKSWWVKNVTVWNEVNGSVEPPEDKSILDYVRIPAYDLIAAVCLSERRMREAGIKPTVVAEFHTGSTLSVVGASPTDNGVDHGIELDLSSTGKAGATKTTSCYLSAAIATACKRAAPL